MSDLTSAIRQARRAYEAATREWQHRRLGLPTEPHTLPADLTPAVYRELAVKAAGFDALTGILGAPVDWDGAADFLDTLAEHMDEVLHLTGTKARVASDSESVKAYFRPIAELYGVPWQDMGSGYEEEDDPEEEEDDDPEAEDDDNLPWQSRDPHGVGQ